MVILDNTDLAFAKKDDSKSKKKIELCCTWGDSLNDGVLTFSIKNGGSDLAKIVKLAINDWEEALNGVVKFKSIKDDNADSDIEIEFKKGKGKKVGKAVTFFDHFGLIDHVARHEFGHDLGLGHAEFKNTLMSTNVDEVITKVSACELESVRYTNSWKFIDDKKSPQPLAKEGFKCKKD